MEAYNCNSIHCKREGSSFITSDLGGLSDLYSPELTAVSLTKFTTSPVGFEHLPGCEKFKSQNFKKIKFLCSYLFVTYLPREVHGVVINEIYFLDEH